MSNEIDWNLVRESLAKDATDAEFAQFKALTESTGLDPIKKEIWIIIQNPKDKSKRRCQIMTGINGFYAIANSHPQYDGLEIEHGPSDKDGVAEWIEAKAYRKERKYPQTARAYFTEYKSFSPIWKSKPNVMLSKCAESMALRKAFPQEMNGLYTTEEMPREYAAPKEQVAIQAAPPKDKLANGGVHEAVVLDDKPGYWSHVISSKCSQKGKTLAQVLEEQPKWLTMVVGDDELLGKLEPEDQLCIAALIAEVNHAEKDA